MKILFYAVIGFTIFAALWTFQLFFLTKDNIQMSVATRYAQMKMFWKITQWMVREPSIEEVQSYYDEMDKIDVPILRSEDIPYIEGSWDEIKDMDPEKLKSSVVLVKNFVGDKLKDFQTMESFIANTNNNNITLGTGGFFESFTKEPLILPIHEAVNRMAEGEKLYGGFLTTLLHNNEKLESAVVESVGKLKGHPVYNAFSDIHSCLHHSFVYYGTWHFANLHSATIPDAFLQLANTKRWSFTVPDYQAFLHPYLVGLAAVLFFTDIRKEATSGFHLQGGKRIPSIDVYSEPGDLLLFPPFWPHSVQNMDESFGLGIGIRPFQVDERLVSILAPSNTVRGTAPAFIGLLMRVGGLAVSKGVNSILNLFALDGIGSTRGQLFSNPGKIKEMATRLAARKTHVQQAEAAEMSSPHAEL